jgi:putative membrane protein
MCRVAASEVLVAAPHDVPLREDFLRWTVALPVAVKNLLRAEPGAAGELIGVLPPDAIAALLAAPHQPLHCLYHMRADCLRIALASPFDPNLSSALHAGVAASVATLTGAMGAMERINGTPLPFAYTAHVRALLLAYLAFVSFVLIPPCGWLAIPALAFLAFALLGTETAAAECERPFRRRADHLPLERYCLVVSDNVAQLLATAAALPSSNVAPPKQ